MNKFNVLTGFNTIYYDFLIIW